MKVKTTEAISLCTVGSRLQTTLPQALQTCGFFK